MNRNQFKTTLVIGASINPMRYSFKAMNMLKENGHPVLALGKIKGEVNGMEIQNEINSFKNSQIDTVTLYINPGIQKKYYVLILEIKPKRVIFNPGAENPEFEELLTENGIETEEACTLVLLRSGQY